MKNIVLIGLPGSGKTTISKTLAEALKRPVIDIDEYMVAMYRLTIPEMFEISEEYFRQREAICCQEVASKSGYIISTGGGIIKKASNIKHLKNTGIIVYLDRPIQDIVQDVDISKRPLLKDGVQKIYDLYKQRHQAYLDACDIHILNTEEVSIITNKIIDKVKEYQK